MQSSGFGSFAQPPSGVSPRKPAERISRIFTVVPPLISRKESGSSCVVPQRKNEPSTALEDAAEITQQAAEKPLGTVILSEAKNLQYVVEHTQMEILRGVCPERSGWAQDDSWGGFSAACQLIKSAFRFNTSERLSQPIPNAFK